MNAYIDTQTSLLRLVSDYASVLTTDLGVTFSAINFDAYSDLISIPSGHLIGLENLAMNSINDGTPFFELSCMITIATENDTNNMILSKAVNYVFNKIQPTHTFTMYEESSGAILGKANIVGLTRVLPVNNQAGNTKAFQAIAFEAAFTLS